MPVSFPAGGRWITGNGPVLQTINPATGAVTAELGTPTDTETAIACEAARQAAGHATWRRMKQHHRATLLHRIADELTRSGEALAQLQMVENGKSLKECRAQAASAAATFRYYAAVCETIEAAASPSRGDYVNFTLHQPYGVVAAITPWNSPLTMEAQKVAPALAAGNAVILKPSEITTLPALELARICERAGLPAGLLSVLPGHGRDVGTALINHSAIGMISFTGGTATGRMIAETAARRLIPAALELGGKSPHIIFADADLDAACAGVLDGIFEGMGQSCVAGSRLFVQRSVHDAVVERLRAIAQTLRIGPPDAAETQLGPLASMAHRDRVESYVALARSEGGSIIAGGRRPDGLDCEHGAYYLPTIIAGLSNAARVCREEIFGPVLCVIPFDDEADLVRQANDTVYGLACGIWSQDFRRAWRVAEAVEAGTVWINTYKQLSIAAPFGGFKESGLGREKGLTGLRLYQQTKSIYVATA